MVLDINSSILKVTPAGEIIEEKEMRILKDICQDDNPLIERASIDWFMEYNNPWNEERLFPHRRKGLWADY